MRYIHTKCGGNIDIETKTCARCKKHWNLFTWWMTATEIRPIAEIPTRKIGNKTLRVPRKQYSSWADRLPGVSTIASGLPNWPRWARILSTLVVVGVIVAIALFVRC